jgi:hypothetical protein
MTVPVQPAGGQYQAAIEGLKAVAHLIEVDEETFRLLVRSREHPTIVEGKIGALWFKKRVYLTSYDGFIFVHKAEKPLDLTPDAPGAFHVKAENASIPFL